MRFLQKLATLLLGCILLLNSGCVTTTSVNEAADGAEKQPIIIKFSHVVRPNTPKGRMVEKFQQLVAERLAGEVEVQVYSYDNLLFGDNKVLQALRENEVQMAVPSLSKFTWYSKQLQIYELPFLFKDLEAIERFQKSRSGQKLLESLTDSGLLGLGYFHNGIKQLSANTPLRVPEDAEGLHFRIMASKLLEEQFQALGATTKRLPFSKVYFELKKKNIDGQENTWSNIYTRKFHYEQNYITESNHGLLEYIVVTSNEFWQSIPTKLRKEVKQALDEAIVYGNDIVAKKQASYREKIMTSGRSTVISLTEAERAQWVEAMKPVWKKYEAEIGAEFIEAAYAISYKK